VSGADNPAGPRERRLTPGEIDLVRSVFGLAIDCGPVTLRQRRWWFLQPRKIVMAPDGHLWFPPGSPWWSEDFAAERMALQALLIHEMTHVWQHQQGVNLILKRFIWARYTYDDLGGGKTFADYGIEQQAEIMRHYFLALHGWTAPSSQPLDTYRRIVPFEPWHASRHHPRLRLG